MQTHFTASPAVVGIDGFNNMRPLPLTGHEDGIQPVFGALTALLLSLLLPLLPPLSVGICQPFGCRKIILREPLGQLLPIGHIITAATPLELPTMTKLIIGPRVTNNTDPGTLGKVFQALLVLEKIFLKCQQRFPHPSGGYLGKLPHEHCFKYPVAQARATACTSAAAASAYTKLCSRVPFSHEKN